jgi:hypothetical protein
VLQSKQAGLKNIQWPEFGIGEVPDKASAEEYIARISAVRQAMEARRLTHLVVYGDREHFANLAWLCGYDPRFEEAIFIIDVSKKPLLVVGNEGEGYLPVSPLYRHGSIRAERFQPFSLLDQPRDHSRQLMEILGDESIDENSRVGCAGWKYLTHSESTDPQHATELPSYIADTLRELAGRENVVNATDLFMHPEYGFRTSCSATEIAYFEFTNILASEGMKNIIFGLEEGMVDYDVFRLAGLIGEPLGCHPTFVTAQNRAAALSGPVGALIKRGEPLATNICYWGSNCCRAGWIASSSKELNADAQDYVENFVGPYIVAVSKWLEMLRIDTEGGRLWRIIQDHLQYDEFHIFLNPGHLIHLDEWVSSPMYEDSKIRLRSGMAIQIDIIPSSDVYFSTRVEDGLILADRSLRKAIQDRYPDCYTRCCKRREFMMDTLGFDLPEEVLPLSNIPGIVPPFFLSPNEVMALEK